MKIIQSIQNETIKLVDKLHDKKVRTSKQKFIVEGYHLVEEAYKHNQLDSIFTINEEDFNKFKNCEQYLVTEQIIKKLSTTINPQGIIGVVKMQESFPLDLNKETIKIVLLDNVNDPGNLGSIVRTAAALGYDAIYMSSDTVDIYNEKTIRATQGSIFKIPFYYGNLETLISKLKKNGIICFGTTLENSVNLENVKHCKRYAVCFGNEARGMNEDTIKLMDKNIKIEMQNDVESLNVLAASSIVLYELKK